MQRANELSRQEKKINNRTKKKVTRGGGETNNCGVTRNNN